MTDAAHIAALEDRITKLEATAVLFEEHRQGTITFNKQLKELQEQWKREDAAWKKRELEASATRSTSLWEQVRDIQSPVDKEMLLSTMQRNFAELKQAIADLAAEIRKSS